MGALVGGACDTLPKDSCPGGAPVPVLARMSSFALETVGNNQAPDRSHGPRVGASATREHPRIHVLFHLLVNAQ